MVFKHALKALSNRGHISRLTGSPCLDFQSVSGSCQSQASMMNNTDCPFDRLSDHLGYKILGKFNLTLD